MLILHITPIAEDDLAGIWAYIAIDDISAQIGWWTKSDRRLQNLLNYQV